MFDFLDVLELAIIYDSTNFDKQMSENPHKNKRFMSLVTSLCRKLTN